MAGRIGLAAGLRQQTPQPAEPVSFDPAGPAPKHGGISVQLAFGVGQAPDLDAAADPGGQDPAVGPERRQLLKMALGPERLQQSEKGPMVPAGDVDRAFVLSHEVDHPGIGELAQRGSGPGQVLGCDVPLAAVGRHVDRRGSRPDHTPHFGLRGNCPRGGRVSRPHRPSRRGGNAAEHRIT